MVPCGCGELEFVAVFGLLLAGSTVVILPAILIFLFLRRYFLSGVLEGSIKVVERGASHADHRAGCRRVAILVSRQV
jgi:hypothetical protein